MPTVNSCRLCRGPGKGNRGAPNATLETTAPEDSQTWQRHPPTPQLPEKITHFVPVTSAPRLTWPPAADLTSAGPGSEPQGLGWKGVAGMLWNLLYNKSPMRKPAVGSSLYPEMDKEEKKCL